MLSLITTKFIRAMKRKLTQPIRAVGRWIQCLVRRPDPWTYGRYKSLKARKHRDGQMEIWAERNNPDHSLWIETHPIYWNKFQANLYYSLLLSCIKLKVLKRCIATTIRLKGMKR